MVSRNTAVFDAFVTSAVQLAGSADADAILFLLDANPGWDNLLKQCLPYRVVVVSEDAELLQDAAKHTLATIKLDRPEAAVHDRLTQAVLESVADELVKPGSTVIAVYSGFDVHEIDTVSVFHLSERLGRLTARDLQKLETNVPLDKLKVVVDLAVEIGREGREGKPVGTMFVVGDHRRVMEQSRAGGFDLVRGYKRKERNIVDPRVREGIKEIAQLDGAFVVAADGTVVSSCRLIDTDPVDVTLTTGLGARHLAAAAISKNTNALAVVVSESSGTVRLFQNGEVVLRIEPFRRALKWKSSPAEPHLPADGA